MKLATTMYSWVNPEGPVLFKDGNVEKNIKMMNKYGYYGADLFIKNISKKDIKEYRKLFFDNNSKVVTLFAIFLGQQGVKLTEKDKARRECNISLFKQQLDNAKLIDAEGLGLGYIRGMRDKEETEEEAMKRVTECLWELGEYAENIGTKILLEPINRYEINTCNSAYDSVDYIKRNHLKGVSLCLDLFHMNIEDKSIEESIRHAKGLIANVHAPDSNRRAVGDGHLEFTSILSALKDAEYDGYLTLEAFVNDEKDLERTMKQSADILLPIIKRL